MGKKLKLAIWKFTSCDGCQLSLLDCEDELLTLGDHIDICKFLEATKTERNGPYDLSIIEGSITTKKEAEHVQKIREKSKYVLVIGACAISGGIQALKNFKDHKEFIRCVYASPQYISTLETSSAISEHIKVDFELRGCPINKYQLLEIIKAFLQKRKANIPTYSVCVDCKLKGNICIMVASGTPCLGPITQSGCDAICPSYKRGCYACYGPKENINAPELVKQLYKLGLTDIAIEQLFATYHCADIEFASIHKQKKMVKKGTTNCKTKKVKVKLKVKPKQKP